MYLSMKTYCEVGIQFLKFTWTLNKGEYLASCSGRFAHEATDVFWMVGCGTTGPISRIPRLTPMPQSSTLLPSYCNDIATLTIVMLIHYTHNSKDLQKYMMLIICAYRILDHKKFINNLYCNFGKPSQFTKTDY